MEAIAMTDDLERTGRIGQRCVHADLDTAA
jgi:hypothetical protein